MPIMEAENFAALYNWKLMLVYLSICLLNSVLLLFSSAKFCSPFSSAAIKSANIPNGF